MFNLSAALSAGVNLTHANGKIAATPPTKGGAAGASPTSLLDAAAGRELDSCHCLSVPGYHHDEGLMKDGWPCIAHKASPSTSACIWDLPVVS